MTWDQIAAKWTKYKGELRAMWAKLTDDDLDAIDGKREVLVAKLQRYYGTTREMAEEAADEFITFLTVVDDDEGDQRATAH